MEDHCDLKASPTQRPEALSKLVEICLMSRAGSVGRSAGSVVLPVKTVADADEVDAAKASARTSAFPVCCIGTDSEPRLSLVRPAAIAVVACLMASALAGSRNW